MVLKGVSQIVVINPERCKGCELCVLACPMGNLSLAKEVNSLGYHPVVWKFEGTRGRCTFCGFCYWICPDHAIEEVIG